LLVGCCLRALRGGSNQEDVRCPFRELQRTMVPDGVWCFPLVSEMCAECILFWFPRRVCLSEGLALPPTGFGCRELFIRSVPSGSGGVSEAADFLLLCPYPREPRGLIQFPLGPGMWAGVSSVGGLFRSAVSGVPTCPGGEVSLPRGLGAESWRQGARDSIKILRHGLFHINCLPVQALTLWYCKPMSCIEGALF